MPRAYELIAVRAREVLEACLAARKLVDVEGPCGYAFSAVSLGRSRRVQVSPTFEGRLRLVQPLLELRVPFELPLADLGDVDRGADTSSSAFLIVGACRSRSGRRPSRSVIEL